MAQKFKLTVNDTLKFSFTESDINILDIINLSPSQIHVLENNKSHIFNIEASNFYDKSYTLSENNNKYNIKIQNELDNFIQEIGLSATTSKKSNTIKAPMPGFILNINIKEGQKVEDGDALLILEAMKMENTITAPKTGVIKSINIKIGETVKKGQLMIELQ